MLDDFSICSIKAYVLGLSFFYIYTCFQSSIFFSVPLATRVQVASIFEVVSDRKGIRYGFDMATHRTCRFISTSAVVRYTHLSQNAIFLHYIVFSPLLHYLCRCRRCIMLDLCDITAGPFFQGSGQRSKFYRITMQQR